MSESLPMSPLILDIAVGISVHKTFHYLAPEELKDTLIPGSRVLVPFGSRRVIGTVLGFPDKAGRGGLKSIIEVMDNPVPPDLMKLAHWMADYYLHPLGQTLETMIPRAVSRPKRRRGKEAGNNEDESVAPDAPPELMPEQAETVRRIGEAVAADTFEVFLLHGVTGSGKTEVYLRSIASLAGTGRGAVVLVPEIALTPQLLGRFKRRFGNRVAVLHSGLTERERADEYLRIRSGQVDVAVGARSAVFAPFQRLGLVIVDEEHENSYKQDDGLRYHARDTAVMRAKFQNAVCVLGSATPSLESHYNAKNGKYRYLRISNRVDHRPMPQVEIIDVKAPPKASACSPALVAAVRQRLEKKEQTLLFLNRRGFSSVLICGDCGAVIKCPSCSVSLTFHKNEKKLKCHYCDFHMQPPDACPSCKGLNLKPLGTGTQKVEEEVASLFPDAKVVRMDSDSVKGRNAYDTLLGQVDRGEINILLGTQMVAKGHDFPAVTLVGVVDADVGLNLPDFRSAEKTFQLITQAAGRAGRGETTGEVIIQTMNPGHYSLLHSRTHDYDGFYNEEIKYREELGYPPVRRIIKLEIKCPIEKTAAEAAKTAKDRIRSLLTYKNPPVSPFGKGGRKGALQRKENDTTLLGPAPSPISKVRGKYRFQMLLLSSRRDTIRMLAVEARKVVEEKFGRKVQVIVDVDPVNLM